MMAILMIHNKQKKDFIIWCKDEKDYLHFFEFFRFFVGLFRFFVGFSHLFCWIFLCKDERRIILHFFYINPTTFYLLYLKKNKILQKFNLQIVTKKQKPIDNIGQKTKNDHFLVLFFKKIQKKKLKKSNNLLYLVCLMSV